MGGRRRTASNSSVETVSDNNVSYRPEHEVLRRLSPDELGDDASWPCFIIYDATIYYRKPNRTPELHWLANLLHAPYDGPFVLRGVVDAVDTTGRYELYDRLKPGVANNIAVCLDNVTTFSLQIDEDAGGKNAVIWAAGDGGWYEIRPSRAYAPVYLEMNEAVKMYFDIESMYLDEMDLKKKRKNYEPPNLQELLIRYAINVGSGSTVAENLVLLKKQAPFFLSHCRKEEEAKITDVPWSKTEFYKYILKNGRSVVAAIEKRERLSLREKPTPPTSKRPKSPPPTARFARTRTPEPRETRQKRQRIIPDVQRHADADMLDILSQTKPQAGPSTFRKRCPPVPSPQSPQGGSAAYEDLTHSPPPEDEDEPQQEQQQQSFSTQAAIDKEVVSRIVAVLNDIYDDQILVKGYSKSTLKFTQIRSGMFYRCTMDYQTPVTLSSYYAKPLIEALDPERWEGTKYLSHLRAEAAKPNPPSLDGLTYDKILFNMRKPKYQVRSSSRTTSARSSVPLATGSGSGSPAPDPPVAPERPRLRSRLQTNSAAASDSGGQDNIAASASPSTIRPFYTPTATAEATPELEPQPSSYRRGRAKRRAPDSLPRPAGKTPRLRIIARRRGLADDEKEPDNFAMMSGRPGAAVAAAVEDHGGAGDYDSQDDDDDDDDDNMDGGEGRQYPLVVRAVPLPDMLPRGEQGTWVCGEEGCGHVIRAADEADGQLAVEGHVALHNGVLNEGRGRSARERDELLEFALEEGGRRNFPVGYVDFLMSGDDDNFLMPEGDDDGDDGFTRALILPQGRKRNRKGGDNMDLDIHTDHDDKIFKSTHISHSQSDSEGEREVPTPSTQSRTGEPTTSPPQQQKENLITRPRTRATTRSQNKKEKETSVSHDKKVVTPTSKTKKWLLRSSSVGGKERQDQRQRQRHLAVQVSPVLALRRTRAQLPVVGGWMGKEVGVSHILQKIKSIGAKIDKASPGPNADTFVPVPATAARGNNGYPKRITRGLGW